MFETQKKEQKEFYLGGGEYSSANYVVVWEAALMFFTWHSSYA